MLMLLALVLGGVSLAGLPVDLLPDITPPVVGILVPFPGASAREVADLVSKPVEATVNTLPGLERVQSLSRDGLAALVLQFRWGTNLADARQEISDKLALLQLPEGASRPVLLRFDPSLLPVAVVSVAGRSSLANLQRLVEREILPELARIDGVADVDVFGKTEPEVQVVLDAAALQALNLTQEQVARLVQASNLNAPAGTLRSERGVLSLRVVNRLQALEDLRNLALAGVPPLPPGTPTPAAASRGAAAPGLVRLGDIARVRLATREVQERSRTDGRPALTLLVQKEADANTVRVCSAVKARLAELAARHGRLTFLTTLDQGEFIRAAVASIVQSLVLGGTLAVAVLFAFLRSSRATLLIALSIPVSVVVTFVLIRFGGLTLNLMTLGGLALGVGMLVDNSIVVIEAIYRHRVAGRPPAEASRTGAEEVAGAITGATATTLAVFLPVVFVRGIVGELFTDFALTVALALVASLVVALTVVPVLAARLLARREAGAGGLGPAGIGPAEAGAAGAGVAPPGAEAPHPSRAGVYQRLLRRALKRRAATVATAAALLVAAAASVPFIGSEFLPPTDEGAFTISVVLPPGSALEQTDARVREIEGILARHGEVAHFTSRVGTGEGLAAAATVFSGGGPNTAEIYVLLDRARAGPTPAVMERLRQELARRIPREAASLTFTPQSSVGGGDAALASNQLQLLVSGPSTASLEQVVPRVVRALEELPGIIDVRSNLTTRKPEVQVRVDRARALAYGLTPAQVATAVHAALDGTTVTRLETADGSLGVRLLQETGERQDPGALASLPLPGARGGTVPLGAIADIRTGQGPVTITRQDGEIVARITARVSGIDLGTATAAVLARIRSLQLPPGFRVSMTGVSELMGEAFGTLSFALALAVVLVFAVLAAQFESLREPLVVMVTLPLAGIGSAAALVLTGTPLGVTAFIGLILLAGIVVNNGIVLVDAIRRLRVQGRPVEEAVVEAARIRERPVWMTTLTTVLGLLPLALGLGRGSEVQAPMAVVVIGGLLSATLLTLVVVPVVYTLLVPESGPPAEPHTGG